MEVLDTAALLAWPLEMLMGGICAESQLDEVERLSPSRHMMLESQGPRFETPNQAAIELANQASQETGDFSGLSRVDLDVLALALSTGHTLVTDDYRLQNVCQHRGHPWRGVVQEGVREVRKHALVCVGCGAVQSDGDVCPDCGSPLKLKRM
ncbi:MAG: NOB1 family endonuclease [Candidatus Poseidoniales archaeon]